MNNILNHKNCLVTGATGGIGREIAKEMLLNGCNLFLTSQNEDRLNDLKKQINEFNFVGFADDERKIFYKGADLRNLSQVKDLIKESKIRLQYIDVLINCAGVFPIHEDIFAKDLNDFEDCFNINVRAPYLLSQAFSQDMILNGWGRIVNIGSSSAYNGFKNTAIYCASKHALLGLSRSLHDGLKGKGVRAFCISPGSTRTEMAKKSTDQDFNTFLDPKEIAKYISFVISFDGNMVSEEVRLNRMEIK